MNLRKTILLFLILFGNLFFGQKANDSLLLALKNHPERDHIRCSILEELRKNVVRNLGKYEEYSPYDFESGQIALENLQKKNINSKDLKKYKFFYANSLRATIFFYTRKADYKNAMFYAKKTLKLHSEINNSTEIGYDLMQLGNIYLYIGFVKEATNNYYKSINYLKKREGLIEEENNYLSYIYDQLTDIFTKQADYKKGIKFQIEKLKLANSNYSKAAFNQKLNEKNKADTYTLIGSLYSKQTEYVIAMDYFYKAIKTYKSINYMDGLCEVYKSVGLCYLSKKQNQKAITYIKASQKVSRTWDIKIQNDILLSDIYLSEGKIDSAYYFSMKAFERIKKSKTPLEVTSLCQNLATVYFKKKQYNQAVVYAEKSIAISKKTLNLIETQNSSDLLYQIYKAQGKNKLALKMLEISTQLKDSINRKENQNVVLKADFNYQNEKKEAKIKELSQKKKISELESNKKSILINSIVISFLALLLITYFLFSRYKAKKKNELLQTQLIETQKRLEAEKKATDSELKALKSQMNPHFIFNALNSIQEQFMYGDKLKGNEQLSNFTYLTRQILEVSGKKQITIAAEIDILTKYLELEKMRFAKDFEYTITISKTIDEDYQKLPPMLIQPFVENSVKHGLLHKKGPKTIAIDFDLSTSEAYLICTVIDNGIGRQKSAEIKAGNLEKHHSFSTKSIQQRLELLNDDLQLQELITYFDVLENDIVMGTKVVINIPLI